MSDVIHKLPGLHKLTHLSRTIRSSKIIGSSVLTNLEVIDAKFRYKIASCDIGIIFWSFLGYFWVIFGLFLGYFWVIFGLFLGYFWVIFDYFSSFFGHFWVILRDKINGIGLTFDPKFDFRQVATKI